MQQFPERVSGLQFIEPIAEGASGCTFKVLNPIDSQLYALRIERVHPEIRNKFEQMRQDIDRYMYITNDVKNPFQLRFKYAYVILNDRLPPVITNLMFHSCNKKYTEWSIDDFIGTYSIIVMELGLPQIETETYAKKYPQQFLFGLCYSIYRLHTMGVLHRDIRPPNIIMKYHNHGNIDVLNVFSFLPMENKIPCIIDFDLSAVNPAKESFMYIEGDFVENAEMLYGPTYILQTFNKTARKSVRFVYNYDYWMIGITMLQLLSPTISWFWSRYSRRYERVPQEVKDLFKNDYPDPVVGILWSMAQVSACVGATDYIHQPLVQAIQKYGSLFQELGDSLDMGLRSILRQLLTWDASVQPLTDLLVHPYFNSLRRQCATVGCTALVNFKCLDCAVENNHFCSNECHDALIH